MALSLQCLPALVSLMSAFLPFYTELSPFLLYIKIAQEFLERMQLSLELRYVFLPTIGFALRFLTSQLYSSWPQNGYFQLESLAVFMFSILVIVFLILLCLVISVKFDLKIERLRLRTGDVSGLLTILLLASLILPLPVFWFAYLMLLIIWPCSEHIFNQLKRFVYWLCHTFRATFFCIIQPGQEESVPQVDQIQLMTEVEGNINNA